VKDIPVKLSKDDLREYVAYDHRFNLAKLTNKISVYTDGILTMDKTLMGLIEVDPKEILVDGIRKDLVKTMSTILHETFIF
jgi:WASH complex subunit strumpellin